MTINREAGKRKTSTPRAGGAPGPASRPLPPSIALFLTGIVAGCLPAVQQEVLLFPAFLSPVLETAVLYGTLAGLGLGLWIGEGLSRFRQNRRYLLPGAVLVLAALFGALGVFHPFASSLIEKWERLTGPAHAGSMTFHTGLPVLFFSLAAVLPCMTGLAWRLRLEQSARREASALAGLAGAGIGILLAPLALYFTPGISPSLQFMALFLGLTLLTGRGKVEPPQPTFGGRDRGMLFNANLCAALFGFGCGILLVFFQSLLYSRLNAGYLAAPMAAGFWLLGFSITLFLKKKIALEEASWPFLLICVAALAPALVAKETATIQEDVLRAALTCLPFGAASAFALRVRVQSLLGARLPGLAAGFTLALIFAMFVLHPAVQPGPAILPAVISFLVLEGLQGEMPAVLGRAAAGLSVILLGSFVAGDFWFPQRETPLLRINGTNLTVSFNGNEGPLRALKISGRPVFAVSRETEQHLRMANLSVLFHPNPMRVLVLGPDTGEAAAQICRDPLVKRVLWVNPYDAFNDGFRWKSSLPGGPGIPAGLSIRGIPERFFTRHGMEHFDLIMVPPSPMARLTPHPFFTQEFYQEAGRLLDKGGILCQWVYPHRLPPDAFLRLLSTMSGSFEQFYVFADHRRSERPALALVGSAEGIVINAAHTANRLRQAGLEAEFARIGLDPERLAVDFITAKWVVEVMVPPLRTTDTSGMLHFDRPARGLENLQANMGFLGDLAISSFPWFQVQTQAMTSPDDRRKLARYLMKTGALMQAAALDRTSRTPFNPSMDLKSARDMDLEEAYLLARGLSDGIEYRYIENLLARKTLELADSGKSKDALLLADFCLEQAPRNTTIARARAAVLERLQDE